MFACAACGRLGQGGLCPACVLTLAAGPQLRTPSGVLVTAAYRHEGAARRLVHQLKYTGSPEAALILGRAMVAVLPATATAVVPVTRATLRRWKHGVDPAIALGRVVARESGLPLVAALRPGWWWRRHAGRRGPLRSRPRWTVQALAEPGWVLVDDVATTGATLEAAAAVLDGGHHLGVVATSPSSRISGIAGSKSNPRSWEVVWPVARGRMSRPNRHAPSS